MDPLQAYVGEKLEQGFFSAADLETLRGYLSDLIDEKPDGPDDHIRLTGILTRLGGFEEALKVAQEVIDRADDPKGAYQACLGRACINWSNWTAAQKALTKALLKSEHNLGWRYSLSWVELALGRHKESAFHFGKLLEAEKSAKTKFINIPQLFSLVVRNPELSAYFQRYFRPLARRYRKLAALAAKEDQSLGHIRQVLVETCDNEGVGAVLKQGAFFSGDMSSNMLNVQNGRRVTSEHPAEYDHTLHLYGSSIVFGSWVEDRYTLASCLQKKYNQGSDRVKVLNEGVRGQTLDNILLQVCNTDFDPGAQVVALITHYDLHKLGYQGALDCALAIDEACRDKGLQFYVLLFPRSHEITRPSRNEKKLALPASAEKPTLSQRFQAALTAEGLRCMDLQPLVERPHDHGELFFDYTHLGPNGHLVLADYLAPLLKPAPADESRLPRALKIAHANVAMTVKRKFSHQDDIRQWLEVAKKNAPDGPGPYGAIIMNCNPFTKGHLFLVESALTMVKGLYIFVVEEDRSDYAFTDRLAMIRAAVEKKGRQVSVLPSGRFIISSFSFPGYFSKEEALPEEAYDSSLDVAIFGAVIAPALKISTRFVGEEPFCGVTKAYNETMLEMLPAMGVNLQIIPRHSSEDGLAISASAVRAVLKNGDLDQAKKLTPPSTWPYLKLPEL